MAENISVGGKVPQIFIAHASEDKPQIRKLYNKLKSVGYRPWLDEEDLLPGQNWREEIPTALKNSDLFLACLSSTSISKRGYIQREFQMAMEILAELPPGNIYLIPLKLDDCQVPDLRQSDYGLNFRDLQWLNYYQTNGFEKLIKAIEYQFGKRETMVEGIGDNEGGNKTVNNYYAANNTANTNNINAEAIESWKDRLAYFQQQEAIASDPAQKFQLEKDIQKCLQKIQDLEGNEDNKKTGKGDTEEIEILRVNKTGKIIRRQKKQVTYVKEMLPREVEMSFAPIPGGSFMMGTANAEIELLCKKFDSEWFRNESPIHSVTVPPFLMGKYPVTQQQWYAIALADFLKVNIDLNPEPSHFKGDERPVELVNWYEAVEFCQRLSKWTGKDYQLPTEAQWEYACRAGTTTPYYFGETITTDLANYNGNYLYASEAKGQYRKETTPVGAFPPNGFGLYDMHGNVWEWCLDDWHDNYQGAPNDGKAWMEFETSYLAKNKQNKPYTVVCGGSWNYGPVGCRCALCLNSFARVNLNDVGFRVVCAPPRTS